MDPASPSTSLACWPALLGSLGAAFASLLGALGLAGPWGWIAFGCAVVAACAFGAWLSVHRARGRALRDALQRVRDGELAAARYRDEIDRHSRLESEMLEARQTAESAVLAKGEFLATMSHEIRTPLNGIVPMLDLLLHAPMPVDQQELVRTAYGSSMQMQRIVDDILDYSKLEADRLVLETTVFNLRELLEDVLQSMERPAEAKGLRMHLQVDPGVRLPVRGDPVRLRQVLGNLIGNAVKFTERGTITVAVRRVSETAAQHHLHFEVRDTGIGIAPEAQPRLFVAFSQADASTTRLYGGTGLGLAICKRIVELMGGRIGVESEPARGSRFWFEIPLLKVQGDLRVPESAGNGSRVLLVTADPRLRSRLTLLLPNWGLRLTTVETTQEALDRLRNAATQGKPWAYEVVVADIAGMRSGALALRRNLERQSLYGEIRLLCLYGDDYLPDDLREKVHAISRQAPDADLRQAIAQRQSAKRPSSEAARSESDPESDGSPPSLRHLRTLLVEDNPVNLMVGQRLLSVLGVDCDTASNGEVALMRMSASRYDLVLMDCQMPVMDGYTATRLWRESELADGQGKRLPIVAMTANAMAGDRQKCLDAGMDDYLPKPVTRAELERCLHRWRQARPERAAVSVDDASRLPSATEASTGGDDAMLQADAGDHAPYPPPVPAAPSILPAPPAGAPPTQDAGPIDLEILGELRDMLGEEVDRLIRIFLEDAPELIAKLETAALRPDYPLLYQAAHSLKSSSANLGALALSAAARRVEVGARTESLDRPAVAVALVAEEFDRARGALLVRSNARA